MKFWTYLFVVLLASRVDAQKSFVVREDFPDDLTEQITSLAQYQGQTISVEEEDSVKVVLKTLTLVTAPHILALSNYGMRFVVNCSIFF
jgi:hypothetical protein